MRYIPKLSKFLKLSKLPTPLTHTVVNSRAHLLSKVGSYKARRKIPAMDSTKAYSHCRDIFVSRSRYAFITANNLSSKGSSSNAAIKPKAIAVATKCKGRRLKMGACSQLFKLALCGCYAPRPILLRHSSEGSSQMSQRSAIKTAKGSTWRTTLCWF